MRHAILARVLIVIAVAVLSIWAIYPPTDTIPLGLDLNGGVQLVLQVRTDDALRLETQATVERVRQQLADERIPFSRIHVPSATEFAIAGVADEATRPGLFAEAEVTFDRIRRDGTHTFRMKPAIADRVRRDTVQQAMHTIERRVNELGVAEAMVARYLEDDQILVQLPGVTDVDHAKQIIKSTAQLRLTLVENGPFHSRDDARRAYNGSLPEDLELLPGPRDGSGPATPFYVVQKVAVVSGNDLRDARQSTDEFNRPAVAFTLKPDAGVRFGAFTGRHVNRVLATVLDGRITSVATILSRIDEQGQIVGISRDEMIEQVITFKSGALPAGLDYVEEHTVGASLGEASIRSGVLASAGGLAFVVLFMLGYYRWTGLNALVSIALNLLVLLGLVALVPVTMTLPGIAGLILTIGMGVDSNVLIFERLKEELARSRSARGGHRGVRSRLDHDRRHPRHIADCSSPALPVRDQPHSRVRHDAHDRPARQRLHRGVRVANPVRGGAVAAWGIRPVPEHFLGCAGSHHQPAARPGPVALARRCPVARGDRRRRGLARDEGDSPRDRLLGWNRRGRRVRDARHH